MISSVPLKPFLIRPLLLTAIAALTTIGAAGQSLPTETSTNARKGRIKLHTLIRDYWITGGQSIALRREIVSQTENGTDGRAIRHSQYGNIEQRYVYKYPGGTQTAEVQYYDKAGARIPDATAAFTPKADIAITDDLCNTFSTRSEFDKKAGIERKIETCSTGSIRATILTERNTNSGYFREFREDAKGRTYEYILNSDAQGNPKEFTAISNNLKTPKYSWHITGINHKSDSMGNLIEVVASAIHSSKPNQVWFQYVEKFEIEYFQ